MLKLKLPSWRRVKSVTLDIVFAPDTMTLRAILALASLLYGINLILASGTMSRTGFILMFNLMPNYVWSGLFLTHFVGLSWKFLAEKPKVGIALAVNSLGFFTWFLSTLAINIDVFNKYGTLAPSTSLEIVVCAFAGWALFRTGKRL
jgi:hypothetical protein